HQIRCSITVKGGSHGCSSTHFRRHADRPIRPGQKLGEDMLNLTPLTANISDSVFTIQAVSSTGSTPVHLLHQIVDRASNQRQQQAINEGLFRSEIQLRLHPDRRRQ
ncbi:hypothetical protein ACLOJK_029244, partial [Asimina triloba]